MPKEQKYYQNLAKEMIDRDKGRNILFEQIDRMVTMKYELPHELRDVPGVHKVTMSDPHDAVKTATNVLTNADPIFNMRALLPDEINRKFADDVEEVISFWFRGANRRKNSKPFRDIVKSAMRYDEVCFQVVDLRNQAKATGIPDKKLDRALKMGPFAIEVYNPKDVHVTESSWGLESVLTVRTFPANEVIKFWGEKASALEAELQKRIKGSKSRSIDFFHVTVFDYWDEEIRYVWCIIASNATGSLDGNIINILEPEEHGLDFIPWVAIIGGTSLASSEEDQREPLLYPVVKTGAWETQNIAETILMTKAIQNSARETREVRAPNPEEAVSFSYDEMGSIRNVSPTAEVRDLPPMVIDDALLTQASRVSDRIATATVPKAIQGADLPSGVAFSTINTVIQAGLGTVGPYRKLAEMSLAEMATIMLEWAVHMDEPIEAYSTSEDGVQIVLEPDELDPNAIDISVKLQEDVPINELQKINAASIAVNSLRYPIRKALEDIGVSNPVQAMRDRFWEELTEQMFANERERLNQELALDFQRKQGELQIQLDGFAQEQAMALQQQQQPQMQMPPQMQQGGLQAAIEQGLGPLGSQQQPGTEGFPPTGLEQAFGAGLDPQGVNPAMGGNPAALFNPQATFEEQTGNTRGGEPIA